MEWLERVPLCDITTFAYPESKTEIKEIKMKRHLEDTESKFRNYQPGKRRSLRTKKSKYFSDDPKDEDYTPERGSSEKEDYDKNESSDSGSEIEGKSRKFQAHSKSEGLTEYEKMVLKNKEERIAFLETLKMNEVKESFYESVQSVKPKSKPKPFKTVNRPPQSRSPIVRRKSLRLAKVDLDLSEEAIVAKAKAIAYESLETQRKKFPPVLPFKDALQEENLYENFNKDFSDLDQGEIKPFFDYASHFGKMQVLDSHIAKVVYSRITALTIHPIKDRILVSAGSKYGKIGFWNVNSDSNPYVFEPHTEGITHLKFNPEKPHLIMSSSYDGTVRYGDVVKSVFNEVYNVSEETSCTFFEFLSPNTFLVARRDGNVSVVDSRVEIKSASKTHQCHDYSVKSLSVHPLDKTYFITAENKGVIKLWDLRKLQKQPVVEVHHHKRCVQSAYFSPLTGKSLLTLSSDDTICLFDTSNLGNSVTFKQSMKHNNQTGRWLTTFRATWLPNTDDTFVVGSMQYPRKIEIYNDNMKNIFNFTDDNLGCITSLNCFHPSMPVLAGASSGGKVFVFTDGTV